MQEKRLPLEVREPAGDDTAADIRVDNFVAKKVEPVTWSASRKSRVTPPATAATTAICAPGPSMKCRSGSRAQANRRHLPFPFLGL